MKYIIFEDQSGMEWPVVFPEHVQHVDIANRFGYTSQFGYKLVSAGFCSVQSSSEGGENKWFVYGRSVGLGIKPREEDGDVLGRRMNFRA